MSSVRVRWYRLPVDRSLLRRVSASLANTAYTQKRGQGFVLEEVRPSYIMGRHVERVSREVVSLDPFGKEIRQPLTSYVHSKFRLGVEAPGLEITNAPRSVQMLLSQLAAAAEFEVEISPLDVDPLAWLAHLDARSTVRKVVYTDIAFRGGAIGILHLEGVSDVREAGTKILGERKKTVRRVVAEWQEGSDSRPTMLTLERDARAVIQSADADDTSARVRDALVRATMSYART